MLELIDRVYRFRSRPSQGDSYLIEVGVDSKGVTTVRSIRSERSGYRSGCGGGSEIPSEVVVDVGIATEHARVLSQMYRVWSDRISFRGEPHIEVGISGFVSGPFYLVQTNSQDGTFVAATDLTSSSFILRPVGTLGSPDNPVGVNVEVVVPTVLATSLSGEVKFSPGEWVKSIPLGPNWIPKTAYRVLVHPVGAFPVTVREETDHFDIVLGAGVPQGSFRLVRYAVVVG